jgi:hypothetical protein
MTTFKATCIDLEVGSRSEAPARGGLRLRPDACGADAARDKLAPVRAKGV